MRGRRKFSQINGKEVSKTAATKKDFFLFVLPAFETTLLFTSGKKKTF